MKTKLLYILIFVLFFLRLPAHKNDIVVGKDY